MPAVRKKEVKERRMHVRVMREGSALPCTLAGDMSDCVAEGVVGVESDPVELV